MTPSLSLVLELLNLINSVLKTMVLRDFTCFQKGTSGNSVEVQWSFTAKGMGSCSPSQGTKIPQTKRHNRTLPKKALHKL